MGHHVKYLQRESVLRELRKQLGRPEKLLPALEPFLQYTLAAYCSEQVLLITLPRHRQPSERRVS
jgi:hypothetical protein